MRSAYAVLLPKFKRVRVVCCRRTRAALVTRNFDLAAILVF